MKLKNHTLTLGLATAAAAQTIMLAASADDPSRERMPGPMPPDLSNIMATDAAGDEKSLVAEGPVLVLVFDPECKHTQRVTGAWRDWLRDAGAGRRVVGLSATVHAAASAYASEAAWSMPVLTVRAGAPGSPEHVLVSRTPWVFALDGDGAVLADGHGRSVSRVARALGAAGRAANGPASLATLETGRNDA